MVIKSIRDLLRKLYYFKYYSKFQGKAKNIILSKNGYIKNPEEISFGKNIFIGRGFNISANKLQLGSNIMIGPNVLIECSNHTFTTIGKTIYSYSTIKSSKGIKIEDDVWIGGNVSILDGVTIGEGCVVGASSNVIKSLPPYTICVGNPCKPIKKRFDDIALKEHLLLVNSRLDFNQILKLRNLS
jgi:maltose O-acetyltransferase